MAQQAISMRQGAELQSMSQVMRGMTSQVINTINTAKNHMCDLAAEADEWLDSESGFYSSLMGESITWRKSLRMGVVLPALMTGALITAVSLPLVTIVLLLTASVLLYHNK